MKQAYQQVTLIKKSSLVYLYAYEEITLLGRRMGRKQRLVVYIKKILNAIIRY